MIKLSSLAKKALLEEVNLDCKPGLVCRNSQGAHDDMDIETFYLSANALVPHFENYQQITIKHQKYDIDLFNQLRQEGIKAERSMFEATGGINTHKGANFIFSLLISATSQLETFDVTTMKKRIIAFLDESGKAPVYTVMLNPEIIKKNGACETEESCLSLLGGPRKCRRDKIIKVRYQTTEFKSRIKTYTDFTAQIIQHEIDHLSGILI